MPTMALFENRKIRDTDIYKYDIPVSGPFTCKCGEKLIFRQNRNGDKSYTEHFCHTNNIKGTHKTCEYKENSMSEWHKKMLEVNKHNTRETKRKKHFVDAYDASSNRGIEFQHSPISPEDIISRENTTELDWIFDVTNQYSCIWDEIAFCEISSTNWEKAIPVCKNKVILDTGKKEWILLTDKRSFYIEIDGKKRHMWIGQPITLEKVIEITCLKNTLTDEGKKKLQAEANLPVVRIIYARCKKSMKYLDPIIRQYALDIDYEKNMIYAIKSVAGSGKTTTLLKLAEENEDKRILYLAFNKAIVAEIRKKKTNNLYPHTFDAFIRQLFIDKFPHNDCIIQELKPYTLGQIYHWFKNKPFKMKQTFVTKYNEFCKDINYTKINEFMENKYPNSSSFTKRHLMKMWNDTQNKRLLTFDSLRKLAFVQHWFKDYVDSHYDMVFIDEAQDFDPLMLEMLLKDTTIPKVFVGDPRQAIYEWRGAINAFDQLPEKTFIMQFYTTWRIGNPACERIREEFNDCWMVAGNNHETFLYRDKTPTDTYDYLFRSWRYLLQTAAKMPNIWINDFNKKKPTIKKLHESLQKFGLNEEDKARYEDDLPNFLLKLDEYELNELISNIERNLVSKSKAMCRMYTIHAYKGMENNNIRVFNDIDHDEEQNIYYVALTRGKQNIYLNDVPRDDNFEISPSGKNEVMEYLSTKKKKMFC